MTAVAPAAESHKRFLATLAQALPARVTVTTDAARGVTAYRIAGPVRVIVQAEIDSITRPLADNPTNWSATFTKPVRWGDEFVAHGEVFVPRPLLSWSELVARASDHQRSSYAVAAE